MYMIVSNINSFLFCFLMYTVTFRFAYSYVMKARLNLGGFYETVKIWMPQNNKTCYYR